MQRTPTRRSRQQYLSPNYSNSPLVTGSLAEDADDVLVLQKFYDKLERLEEQNRSLHTEIGVVRSRNDRLTGEHDRVNRILLDMEGKFSRECHVREALEQELLAMKKNLISNRRLSSTEKTRVQELLEEARKEKARLVASLEHSESRNAKIGQEMQRLKMRTLEAELRFEKRLSGKKTSLMEAKDTVASQQVDLIQKEEEVSSLQKEIARLRARCSELEDERQYHESFMRSQLSESRLEVERQTQLFRESEGVDVRESVFGEVGALRNKVQFLEGLLDRKDREIADKDKETAEGDQRLKEATQVIREVQKLYDKLVGDVKVFSAALKRQLERASEQLGYLKEYDSDDLVDARRRGRCIVNLEGAIDECQALPAQCLNHHLMRALPQLPFEDDLIGQD